jgi:YgiT-type zinc finger domain-containing protein
MTCLYCRGRMERGTAPFHIDRGGVHLSVDAAPAWVCKQCGEPFFEEAEVESIQAIIRTVDEQSDRMAESA